MDDLCDTAPVEPVIVVYDGCRKVALTQCVQVLWRELVCVRANEPVAETRLANTKGTSLRLCARESHNSNRVRSSRGWRLGACCMHRHLVSKCANRELKPLCYI